MLKISCYRPRLFTAVTAVLLSLAGGAVAQGQSLLTLPEDEIPLLKQQLERAMTSSPQMIIQQANAAATLADFDASKSSRYPSLGGWANYLRAEDDRNTIGGARPATKLGYNFTIRKSLYHWGNLERGIENAKIMTLVEEGRTRSAYMTLATEIRKTFMELVTWKHRVSQHGQTLRINRENVEQTRQKQEQNMASAADLFRAELDLQRAELNYTEANDELQHTIRVFARLTGEPPISADQIPDEYPVPPIQEQEEILITMATRFLAEEMPENTSIQETKHWIEMNENNLKNVRTQLRPRFDLMVGISQDEQDFALSSDNYEYQSIFGGVALTWNIFDGFATRNRIKSGLARLRASELDLEMKQEALIDDVRRMGKQMQRRAMAIKIQEQELKSARSHLEYTRDLAKRGEASASDIDSAQANVAQGLSGALYYRYEYWNDLSNFLYLIDADPILNRAPPVNP